MLPLLTALLTAPPALAQGTAAPLAADETAAYRAFYEAQAARDPAGAWSRAQAYLERFPSGRYAEYLRQWIPAERGRRFNQASEARNVPDLVRLAEEAVAARDRPLDYAFLAALRIRELELLVSLPSYTHAAQAEAFGRQAIERIEAGDVPTVVARERWSRDAALASLHQTLAMIEAHRKNPDAALTHYTRAATLAPGDPFNHLACGALHQERYAAAVARYQALPEAERLAATPAPDVRAALDAVERQADLVIGCWIRFMALSEADAAWAGSRTQVEAGLAALYAFRHPEAPEGFREAIRREQLPTGAPAPGGATGRTP